MAQHSNYAKDRDLMMEAYSSVEGNIPHTQSTAPARLYNEAHCDEEHEEAHKYTVIENDKEGSIQVKPFKGEPTGDLIKTVERDGLVKKCYQHPEGREWVVESDRPIDFNQEGSWTWDEDAKDSFPADMPSDEFFAHLDDVSMEVGSESYQAIVDGLEAKLSRKLTEREAAEAKQMAQEDELPELPEDAEGEAGFNGKQLEELEDIVHAILDKRDSEERAAEHYS